MAEKKTPAPSKPRVKAAASKTPEYIDLYPTNDHQARTAMRHIRRRRVGKLGVDDIIRIVAAQARRERRDPVRYGRLAQAA